MFNRRTIHVLDVISILLFSILANFIFGLDLDFRLSIDWIAVLQLCLLTGSTFCFYFAVDTLKKIAAQAEKEYHKETDLEKKEKNSTDIRYLAYYNKKKSHIHSVFITSAALIILYFIIKPTIKYFITL